MLLSDKTNHWLMVESLFTLYFSVLLFKVATSVLSWY